MKNTSFIFYATFYESTQCLTQNRRGKFLCKLLAYMAGEDAPVFSEKEKIEASLFLLMQPQIQANLVRRENGQAGAEHGKKGGRPKKDIDANADIEETKEEDDPENAENSDTPIEEKGNNTGDAAHNETARGTGSGLRGKKNENPIGDNQGLHDVNPKKNLMIMLMEMGMIFRRKPPECRPCNRPMQITGLTHRQATQITQTAERRRKIISILSLHKAA